MISEFPVFTGKIEHAHTVYTRPSLSQREGPGDEASKDWSLIGLEEVSTCHKQYRVEKYHLDAII